MLGQLRRTTRTDVGLALTFVGIAYLVWVLVAGVARELVAD
jgi:Na+(H+)/acetate symporter ActP